MDSHHTLATHSGILSSQNSTTPLGMASALSAQDLSTSELLRTL